MESISTVGLPPIRVCAGRKHQKLVYSVRYDTAAALRQKINKANASLPSGILSTGVSAQEYALARTYLNQLADKSGARMLEASDADKLAAAFALIADELRGQYSLGYYPSNPPQPGQRRKIKVVPTRSKVIVHARNAYVVPARRP